MVETVAAPKLIEELEFLPSDSPDFWLDPVANYAEAAKRGKVYRNSEGVEILDYHAHQRLLRSRQFHADHGLILRNAGITEPAVIRFRTSFLVGTRGAERIRLRSAVADYFGPPSVAKMQDGIRNIVDRVLDEADDGTPFDFLHRVSLRIPALVYLMLIDGPDDQEQFVSRVSDSALKVFLGKPELKKEIETAYLELFDYVERMIALRRKKPGDDLISHLVRLVDTDVMSHQEAVDLIALTLEASVDTTGNTMTSAVGALLADPEAWRLLVSDPDTIAVKARDEALRMFPAVLRNRRVASEDQVFEGVQIPAGTTVFAPNLAAGRDPEIYPQPNTFNLQRESPRPFTTFGGGMFACLGQNIARLDIEELVKAMARNYSDAHLVTPFEPEYHPPMFGLAKPLQVLLR